MRALPGPAPFPVAGQAAKIPGAAPTFAAPSAARPEVAPVAHGAGGSAAEDALLGLGGALALGVGAWTVVRVRRRRDERRLLGDA